MKIRWAFYLFLCLQRKPLKVNVKIVCEISPHCCEKATPFDLLPDDFSNTPVYSCHYKYLTSIVIAPSN